MNFLQNFIVSYIKNYLMALFLSVILGIPLLILVGYAISNQHMVLVILEPFAEKSPQFFVIAPLYVVFYTTFALGIVMGGGVSWMIQRYFNRKRAMRQGKINAAAVAHKNLRDVEQRAILAKGPGNIPYRKTRENQNKRPTTSVVIRRN